MPIATKQAIAFMLADMAIEIDASRLLVWEAAWHLDKGEDALKESYLAKNYAAQRAEDRGQRRAGAGRPRLYPGASGRDVAAQRARIFGNRRHRNGLEQVRDGE